MTVTRLKKFTTAWGVRVRGGGRDAYLEVTAPTRQRAAAEAVEIFSIEYDVPEDRCEAFWFHIA